MSPGELANALAAFRPAASRWAQYACDRDGRNVIEAICVGINAIQVKLYEQQDAIDNIGMPEKH